MYGCCVVSITDWSMVAYKDIEARRRYHREYERRRERKPRKRLTKRREAILHFCHNYFAENKWAPGAKEIMQAVGLRRYNAYYENMHVLDEMGYIIFEGNRQIKVLMLP